MATLASEMLRFESLLTNRYEQEEARSITRLTFEELFHLKAHELRTAGSSPLEEGKIRQLEEVLQRLIAGEPIQYILGFAWFNGERYFVNSNTLIPRPETEELVHWILEEGNLKSGDRLLDIGTGSGCIAIALQMARPTIRVFGMDISHAAINTARMNALNLLGAEASHRFFEADLADASWWESHGKWDIIVSNPPYILESEKVEMESHVLDHEPSTALFVPEHDPLIHYRGIAEAALHHLQTTGFLFFEINAAFGKETMKMLESLGYSAELKKDMFEKDRMIKARKN